MKESEKVDKYLNLVREMKKLWNMKSEFDGKSRKEYNYNNNNKGTGGLGSWWTRGGHPDYYIIENG